jgi:hypothetical protein
MLRSTNLMTATYTFVNNTGTAYTIPYEGFGGVFVQNSSTTPQYWPLETSADNGVGYITIPPVGTASITIAMDGFPNTVCCGQVFPYLVVGGLSPNLPPQLCYLYQVDSTPCGFMSVPWCDVLNDSCKFADSQTGLANVAQKCTQGLWGIGLFKYVAAGLQSYYIDQSATSTQGMYELVRLLRAAQPAQGDCRDISSFLQLCLQSQGVSCSLKQLWTGVANQVFSTNLIKPIGSTESYSSTDWNFHQVVEIGSNVYDACARQKFDTMGNLYQDTPYNWPEAAYWQNQYNNAFWGLVSGLLGQSPGQVPPKSIDAVLGGPNYPKSILILKGVY